MLIAIHAPKMLRTVENWRMNFPQCIESWVSAVPALLEQTVVAADYR